MLLPYFATGNRHGKTLVMIAGFPDDQISGSIFHFNLNSFFVDIC